MDDDIHGRRELAVGSGPTQAGSQGQRLDPGRDVDGRVGVQGAATALVAGVERRHQVHHLRAAHLADHQPVGPHPQRLADQGPQLDGAGALDVGGPALQRDDVRMVGTQLAGVLDQHHPLRRVTRDSSAASRVVLPEPVPPLTRNARRDSMIASSSRATSPVRVPEPTSSSTVKTRRARDSQRDQRARPSQRRQHGVEAAAVGEPEVAVGRGVVEPATTQGGEALGQAADGGLLREPDRCQLEPGTAVEVDPVRTVDQDVGDVRGPQQRLERSRTDHVAA